MKIPKNKKAALKRRVETLISKNMDLGFAMSEVGMSQNMDVQDVGRKLRAILNAINNN